MKRVPRLCFVLLWSMAVLGHAARADETLDVQARAALTKSTAFYRSLATEGGYLWWYSQDLSERAGEAKATPSQIWVQPPGTPTVGTAFLRAYAATKEKRYLDAAQDAADALAKGQLESGGWDYLIDFDPQQSRSWYRRSDQGKQSSQEISKRRNRSTLDDNNTQSALRFLMAVVDASQADVQLASKPESERAARIREALEYGLQSLLRAQYPTGGWPQRYEGASHKPEEYPLQQATIPPQWPRTFPKQNYYAAYTLNDNTLSDCISTMLEAYRRDVKAEYLQAAERGGDFLIRAQLPQPQAAWAQQYNFQMQPIWARKFEPSALSSAESGDAIRSLLGLHLATGDRKYLEPIPAAIAWLRRSVIAPNKWARFYEFGSNRPLYFTKEYQLVYSDDDLPTHYSFQNSYGLPAIIADYENLQRVGRPAYLAQQKQKEITTPQKREALRRSLEPRVRQIIAALDDKGRWLKDGRLESDLFIRNTRVLSDYLK